MYILGLSFGRKMGNTDILVKEALFGAREAEPDAEIKFINTNRLKIDRCIGCGACSGSLEKGGDNDCIIKDDMQMVEDEIRKADCLIVGAPVYVLQPVGQFKNLVDRFSCRHDVSAINWVLDKRRAGQAPGDPDAFPQERFKRRTVSYISVGGATTKNWVSMGTATMHLFGFPAMMKVVGNYDAHHMGTTGNPVLDEKLMSDIHEMGKQTALAYHKKDEEIEWFGETGTCPVCHQNLLMMNGTTTVECPICGIEGKLSVEGDQVKVTFSEQQQARARGTFAGLREHTVEIQGFGAICGPKLAAIKDELPEMLDKYKNFDAYINK
ncbi:FMN reductase [Butyricicoccus pullicaecorum]|uniref:FMN reductase n=1 Tax=Butyricicoccus pullicaecorum TaxID=501571 RepID=A0A1Y4L4W9_9FIRM|nr:flavodoxin family protein [Butyricicoccus pullicaecorum]OUP51833.1 FMN reductase [Butyricicoccus pullicaecorum]